MIGTMIGFAFAVSLVAAPALYQWTLMAGLFVLTSALCIAPIGVVKMLVPEPPPPPPRPADAAVHDALQPELLRLNLVIFVLHVVQMAMFVVLPTLLVQAGLPLSGHWRLYLPVVL